MPVRVIPVLLIQNGKLVKSFQFNDFQYVGDPINACKVFNEKEIDELIVLDISASQTGIIPYDLLEEIASECFMPVTYGGGISKLSQIQTITSLGIERVSINSFGVENTHFFSRAVNKFGSSTIVASVDVKKQGNTYSVYTQNGNYKSFRSLELLLQTLNDFEVGEILIQSIDKDGTLQGYDFELLQFALKHSNTPITICGGAHSIADFQQAKNLGASGLAAGANFVFYGPLRAVLINYLSKKELDLLQ